MTYYVYIMTNDRHTVLYVGVTKSIENRAFDHKVKRNKNSFTAKYNCRNLVYYEEFGEIKVAIYREKQLKKYHRKWKEELIEKTNPEWKDLSEGWYDPKEFELFKKFDHCIQRAGFRVAQDLDYTSYLIEINDSLFKILSLARNDTLKLTWS